MISLLPKQPIYGEYFEELSSELNKIATVFYKFTPAFKDSEKISKKAHKIENKADLITHNIIEQLNRTFITPFDREDIYSLAQEMDDLIDFIEDIINNIYVYNIKKGDIYTEKAAKIIYQDAKILGQLVTECFKGKRQNGNMLKLIIKINDLEEKGDQIYQKAMRGLFIKKKDPVFIIKWKEIYQEMEQTIDKFQKVCDIIQAIIVKSS